MDSAVQREYNCETEVVKSRIVNYWSAQSDSFMIQREEELQSGQHQIWARELLSHLQGKTGLRILDVGCGCGFFSLLLAENGHYVTGIDLTGDMVLHSRELAGRHGIRAETE